MVSNRPLHRISLILSAVLLIATVLGSAVQPAAAVVPPTNTATTPHQTNVANPGPLTGLANGDTVTFSVQATAAIPTIFGTDIRLCRATTVVQLQSQFNPSPSGNCLANALPGGGTGPIISPDPRASFGPTNTGGTIDFVVGTGSDADLPGGHVGNGGPIVCNSANPCRFWLKESVPTSVTATGIIWVSYDATFASTGPTVPNTPTAVTATAGNGNAAVSWTAPASDGGAAISGYTATASPGGQSCNAVAPALTCTVPGLANFTPYTFTAIATNSAGPSAASSSSSAVTPLPAPPGTPTGVPGNGQVAVSWTAASPAPTNYTVTSTPGSLTCTTATTGCSVTGLNNGTGYTFVVTANYGGGHTAVSAASSMVTPVPPVPTKPGAPTAVSATAGNGQAAVSWTAPLFNGNSPLASYAVTSSPGGQTCSVTAPTTTCTVTGLTNFTPYTFTVTANNNAAFVSDPSTASAAATPLPTPPGTPAGVPGNGQVTVSWSAANPAPTNYTVTSSPGGFTCTTATTGCTVTGLTNGTPYTFVVAANYGGGHAAISTASSTVTPVGPPAAPSSPSATAGNGQATVSWAAPSSTGGSPILSYNVVSSPGGQTCNVSAPSTSCTVSGLSNFTPYTFVVTATNAQGASPASSASAAVTPEPTPPGKPVGTAGNAKVTVAWTAANPAPTTYIVTSTPGSFTCSTATTSCDVAGLAPGTSYTFVVTADYGSSHIVTSPTSDSVAPLGPPSSPTAVTASAGNGQATVSWTAPAANGGSAITGYKVTAAPGSMTCTTVSTSCTVTGLTNFTPYTLTVVATNINGDSAASSPSNAVTPLPTSPGTPTGVASDGAVTVSWTAANPAPTNYTVAATPGGATCSKVTTSCQVAGLTNGTPYTFVVTANYGSGHHAVSGSSAAVTPLGKPGAPTGATASAGSRQVTVSWTAPGSSGGSPISAYTVTSSPGSQICSTTAATTCTVTGLTDGTPYTFTVIATNANGDGAASTPSSAVTPVTGDPGAPAGVDATPGNGQVAVSWTGPGDAGGAGAQITGYTVTVVVPLTTQSTGAGAVLAPTTVSEPSCSTAGATTCTVTGLTNFTGYGFSVTATNWAGHTGPAGATMAAVVPLPDQPVIASVTPGDGQITVVWTASSPVPTGGYLVKAAPGSASCTTTSTTCVLTGLTNSTPYVVTVSADFGGGNTVVSAASAAVTPAAVVPTTTSTTIASSGATTTTLTTTSGSLPTTGSDSLRLLAIALLTILAGGALVLTATRRQRRASTRP